MMHNLPSKLKPLGPPKNALKMLLASKSGGDTENTEDRTSTTTRTFLGFTSSSWFDELFQRIVDDKQQRFPPSLTSHVHAVII